MDIRTVYCPVCDKHMYVETGVSTTHCPICNHHLNIHSMDTTEAIKRIKEHMHVHHIGEYPHIYLREAIDMALVSLTKQIPKQPVVWEEKYYYSPIPNDDWGYECPFCGNRDIDYPDHHCTCGQALDWSELI